MRIKGRPGLHLDPLKHRWVRDEHVKAGSTWQVDQGRYVRVHEVDDEGIAHVNMLWPHEEGGDEFHEGRPYYMPAASVPHHVHDLRGEVPPMPPSGNEAVDAVTAGKGQFLGKGNDGLVFKVGDQVVKVSTTTPYQPENPGHRSPDEAVEHLRKEYEAHQALAGLPHVQRIQGFEHGGRFWLVKPYLQEVDTRKEGALTHQEVKELGSTVEAMHGRGWALGDLIQVGRDGRGALFLMDLGQAAENPRLFDSDNGNVKDLYSYQGMKYLPTGAALAAKEADLRELVTRLLKDGKGAVASRFFHRWREHAYALAGELIGEDDIEPWATHQDRMDEVHDLAEKAGIHKRGLP